MYNNKWANVTGEWLRYYDGGSWSQKCYLPNGLYNRKSLIDKVKELLKEAGDRCGQVKLQVKMEQDQARPDYIVVVNQARQIEALT